MYYVNKCQPERIRFNILRKERGRKLIKEITWIGAKRRRVQGQCPCRVWAEPSVTHARSAREALSVTAFAVPALPKGRASGISRSLFQRFFCPQSYTSSPFRGSCPEGAERAFFLRSAHGNVGDFHLLARRSSVRAALTAHRAVIHFCPSSDKPNPKP